MTRKNVGCRRMLHADKNSTASERTDSQSKCRKEQNKQTPSARVGSKSKPSCAQKARTSRRPKSRQESRTPSHKALYGKTVSDSGFLKKGSRLTTVRKPTWLSEKNGHGRLAVFQYLYGLSLKCQSFQYKFHVMVLYYRYVLCLLF